MKSKSNEAFRPVFENRPTTCSRISIKFIYLISTNTFICKLTLNNYDERCYYYNSICLYHYSNMRYLLKVKVMSSANYIIPYIFFNQVGKDVIQYK
ncbi:unnamed protein product [Paramecium primaurelia]|uniref:Uncharacterized protein n=1 Tax=Paramecium primaurelia TaxID=5886 RepID=A0A8S1KC50_PARPR|nr:unnamed protein product [Paramecium primaurelia]